MYIIKSIEFDNRLELDCIKIYHQLDDNQCQILTVFEELQDCKYSYKHIDGLYKDVIDCIVYCIRTQ